jgi:4-amino-4-deoxy-L-arabinose transferase-like glycosyltransferase
MDVARNIRRTGLPLRSLGESGVPRLEHTPLYLYMLAGLQWFLLESVLTARLMATLFSVGSVLLVYAVINRVGDPLAAACGALVVGLHPFYAVYSHFVRMEVPMCFFILLGAYLVLRWESQRAARFLWLAGVSLGLAVMLKEVALISLLGMLGFVGLYMLRAPGDAKPSEGRSGASWLHLGVALCLPTVVLFLIWGLMAWSISPATVMQVLERWQHAVFGGGFADVSRQGMDVLAWLRVVVDKVLGWGVAAALCVGALLKLWRRQRLSPAAHLAGFVALSVVSASMLVSLKEPRHVIVLVPVAGILVGTLIDWTGVWQPQTSPGWRRALVALATLMFVDASLLRVIPASGAGVERWIDPIFVHRAVTSDRYHEALARAGEYVGSHTVSDAVVTVVHEATVVAYYADRHYHMLYTLPFEQALALLEKTEVLVYDQPVFVHQTEAEIAELLAYIDEHFDVEHVAEAAGREVTVMRRSRERSSLPQFVAALG